ncbi:MAG TPA: hypothetical protein PKH07_13015 [bacterium]|nr:hypothetical protein [bacterium]
MSLQNLSTTLTIALIVSGIWALRAEAQAQSEWKIGMPLVTYWAGPGDTMSLDDRTAAQIRAGGWNLGWALHEEHLDILHRHGLRAMLQIGTPNVDDPAQVQTLDALIERVKNHPALYSYHLVDEPGAGAFPALGKLVAHLRSKDPAHLAYINLFPTYANEAQLQVSADAAERAKVGIPQDFAGVSTSDDTVLRYREHLRQFVEIVKPDLISYDHYHFLKDSDGKQYFLNLALIRAAALEANKPFLNIIQACDSPSEGWRGPGENEVRWLTYTSLAYGAQGICHFRYDVGLWEDRKNPSTPLPLYWAVSRMNREFLAIASELQPLKSIGAYHCGEVPVGGNALPAGSVFGLQTSPQNVLLGYFGKSPGRPTHVVVVNLDYTNAISTTLTGPGAMEIFHAMTQTWKSHSEDRHLKLDIEPDGGVLVRLNGQ